MEEFSAAEISRAANRVKEMQRRAATQNVPEPKKAPAQQDKKSPFSRILELIDLKNFTLDNDSRLLLGILLLLSSEDADELLILALVYIML